jgi:hypothetical protein
MIDSLSTHDKGVINYQHSKWWLHCVLTLKGSLYISRRDLRGPQHYFIGQDRHPSEIVPLTREFHEARDFFDNRLEDSLSAP